MASVRVPPIYDELIDYLLERATPQEILDFEASPQAQERAAELLERNNAGALTAEEQIELEQMLYFDRKISLMKAQAAVKLKNV